MCRDLADRFNEGDTLARLGDTYRCAGNLAAARDTWRQAVTILDELGHPDAVTVRATLEAHSVTVESAA